MDTHLWTSRYDMLRSFKPSSVMIGRNIPNYYMYHFKLTDTYMDYIPGIYDG